MNKFAIALSGLLLTSGVALADQFSPENRFGDAAPAVQVINPSTLSVAPQSDYADVATADARFGDATTDNVAPKASSGLSYSSQAAIGVAPGSDDLGRSPRAESDYLR